MTGRQSMVELKQKVVSSLRMSPGNFRLTFEITKSGDPSQIDEATYKKLQSNLQMRHNFLETVKFFAGSYNEGDTDDNFASTFISELISPDIRSSNLGVECLCIFLNTIFPKIASSWNNETKNDLIKMMKEFQEAIVSSEDYSSRVKEQVTELLISMKLRFNSDIQINEEKASDQLFTIDDLRKLSLKYLSSSIRQ